MSSLNNDDELFDLFSGETFTPLGTTKRRADVHRDGDWHRSVHVFVGREGDDASVLVQRRAAGKKVAGGEWDLSAAEHLSAGESYEAAAVRGLGEELRVEGVAESRLVPLRGGEPAKFTHAQEGLVDNEWSAAFFVRLTRDEAGRVRPDDVEVSETRWVALDEAARLIGTGWGRRELELSREDLMQLL